MMIVDKNVRSLPEILTLAKAILDAGRENEFLTECGDNELLFVVSTDAARDFINKFMNKHQIDPTKIHTWSYNYTCPNCT